MNEAEESLALARQHMVESQILSRGITHEATLNSMRQVPRHEFMPPELRDSAYKDGAQAIHSGQTISQPYIVALMTAAANLESDSKVLEIGTGSGYQAAILSRICHKIFSIERLPDLAEEARENLARVGYNNVQVKVGDGSLGWSEEAPFDAILVTAASPAIPESLAEQLSIGGCLVIPVGDRSTQRLIRLTKQEDGSLDEGLVELVRFVPLIGKEGW